MRLNLSNLRKRLRFLGITLAKRKTRKKQNLFFIQNYENKTRNNNGRNAHFYGHLFSLFRLKMKKFYSIIASLIASFIGGSIFALTTLADESECNAKCRDAIKAEGYIAGLKESFLIIQEESDNAKKRISKEAQITRDSFGFEKAD